MHIIPKITGLMAILILATSCFKTAEEIQREKMVDQMKVQVEQSSQLVAELTQRVQFLQNKLTQTHGQLEEIDYKQKTNQEQQMMTTAQTLTQLQEQVKALSEKVDENRKTIADLNSQLSSQKKYITKVNSTLSGIGQEENAVTRGHKLFEKNKLKEAKEAYLESLDNGKINAAQKNHVWYNLGLIDYRTKNYNNALVYFSKIYTKYPQSSWAPRALLFIARTFDKLEKKDEAQATYEELIKKFPDSVQAKKAQKEK